MANSKKANMALISLKLTIKITRIHIIVFRSTVKATSTLVVKFTWRFFFGFKLSNPTIP
ncbi:hypothetical protein BD408DRAFT_419402 [Parasitella parasitica]|nr:hypothetical protein BD408DRAFT_419402 [Parasitella parasitica]